MKKVLMRFPLTSKARRVPRANVSADHWCAELSPAALHLILKSAGNHKTELADQTTNENPVGEMTLADVEDFMAQGCPGVPRITCSGCPLLTQLRNT